MQLSRTHFIILSCLVQDEANNNVNAMTLKEMQESLKAMGYTYNSYYKAAETLRAYGYLKLGLSVGNSKSYYITEEGKQALESIKNGGNEDGKGDWICGDRTGRGEHRGAPGEAGT